MHFSPQQFADAVQAQEPEMLALLAGLVACPSFSGSEQTAIAFLEPPLQAAVEDGRVYGRGAGGQYSRRR